MSITVMKQALEALDCIYSPLHVREINKVGEAMSALRQAIEQAEKQKHAEQLAEKGWQYFDCPACGSEGAQAFPKPAQEPVAFKIYKPTPPRGAIPDVRDAELPWVYDQDPSSGNVASMWVTPVKADPQPQREWVGLTEEDIDIVSGDYTESEGFKHGARWAQAKLKEKNA